MKRPKTPGPDYYALADGRQFWEFSQQMIVPACEIVGLKPWSVHALISAMEHRFRNGAKHGESETDEQSEKFWVGQIPDREWNTQSNVMITGIIALVDAERKRVGR